MQQWVLSTRAASAACMGWGMVNKFGKMNIVFVATLYFITSET